MSAKPHAPPRTAVRVRRGTIDDLDVIVELRLALLRENAANPVYGRLRRDARSRARRDGQEFLLWVEPVSQDVPGLMQILADTLGKPVARAEFKRATLRGTALLALETLAPDVERARPPYGPEHEPVPGRAGHYRAVRTRFEELYGAVVAP